MANTVNIEIDGKKIVAEQGSMIIEAADAHDVYIPRFCYHKKLSVAANCRMCLVELDGSRKPIPACATPINEGMKIRTRSELARKSQKAVMEFLLINHPLDCPICDQGGQCELQDLAMGYGRGDSRYEFTKTVSVDTDFGPLISTDMTRCINCTRCVRFTSEIAGDQELGVMGRGEHAEIGTFVERAIHSEVSGNIIDLCPVGALTSKPFRFSARAWELQQRPSISAHDCLGSNIRVHTREAQVMRVTPHENENINEVWLSDRDRFSYVGLNSAERLTQPMLKRDGKWEAVDWTTALEIVASSLENVKNAYKAEQIGALISPNATTEEHYLWQKLWRELGVNNIDHRLQQLDFRDQSAAAAFPQLNVALNDIENLNSVLLIGSDIQREQPLLSTRLLKAKRAGARIVVMNSYDYEFNFAPQTKIVASPQQLLSHLMGVASVVTAETTLDAKTRHLLHDHTVTEQDRHVAEQLKQGDKKAIILGALALSSPVAAELRFWANVIAKAIGATFGELTSGANMAGAALAGTLPHRSVGGATTAEGLHASAMWEKSLKAYALFNFEPELDTAQPAKAIAALKQADFVVMFSPFMSDAMRDYADVVLPIVPYTETSGTFVNCNGVWQTFQPVVNPAGEARPGWKVLRVLADFFDVSFNYTIVDDVRTEMKSMIEQSQVATMPFTPVLTTNNMHLNVIGYWPLYRTDNIVRRSEPLQAVNPDLSVNATVHPDVAARFELQPGDQIVLSQEGHYINLPIMIDSRVAHNTVMLPLAVKNSDVLAQIQGAVELQKRVDL